MIFLLLWVIFAYYLIGYPSVNRYFVVIIAIKVVCRAIFVVHIAYAIVR